MEPVNSDIQFLIELQKELNSQDNDCQASPRYWGVGDYKWIECHGDNTERYSVYLPNDAESYEINYYINEVVDKEELTPEALEALEEVTCEDEAFDWIKEYDDEDATLHPEQKVHYVRHSTMFLTKEEAKRHIELNHYHYTPEAHTYAMTAWRAPKVERLMKILSEFDFDRIQSIQQERDKLIEIMRYYADDSIYCGNCDTMSHDDELGKAAREVLRDIGVGEERT